MKKITVILVSFVLFFSAYSQQTDAKQDPQAKKILDSAAEKMKQYKTIQANFELTIEDRKEGTKNESEGKIKTKGEKYVLESMGTTVFYDGKTMWTYMKDVNEVTITEPDMDDEDFLSNPAKILNWYNRDFKYRHVGEIVKNGIPMHEIDLFPNDLNQPYSRIKLFLGKEDMLIYLVKSVGKEGLDYTVSISNYILDKELLDTVFTFNKDKYKNAEIVDMRL